MTLPVHPWCFISLLLLRSTCKTIQFSCNGPEYCVNVHHTKPQSGKRLLGYNYRNETTSPNIGCLIHCSISCLCLSVNQKTLRNGAVLCELNFEDVLTANDSLAIENGYEYFEMSIGARKYKVGAMTK